MNDKKKLEIECLDTTLAYIDAYMGKKAKKYFYSIAPMHVQPIQTERPDFVFNVDDCDILLEHFLIDFCYDGPKHNHSQSKRASRDIQEIFTTYHDPEIGTLRDSDMEAATVDIEEEINRLFNISQTFSYEEYVQGFKRVFNDHYQKISRYKDNPEIKKEKVKVGFLIEFHCDTCLLNAVFNGSIVTCNGGFKQFPITKDIVELFTASTGLDFVIISQYIEGVLTEPQYVAIYEPQNMKKSIETQKIKVYDSVFYTSIKKNITLNVEKR